MLKPLIQKHYPQGKYVYSSDSASAHYAHIVQEYLKEEKINYLPKLINQANVPKAHPIKNFRANFKQKVYEKDWKAKIYLSLNKKSNLA